MTSRDIIVIGASAGGLTPLQTLVGGLPADFPAAILVVMHVPATPPSLLPQVLSRSGALRAKHSSDGERIEHGQIYVAPPDRHLIVRGDRTYLRRGARENGSRPAIDPLFRTAAEALGSRVLGIVLSGTRTDGAVGLAAVVSHGGASLVQDPDEALYPGMPRAAIELTPPDFVLRASEMPSIVRRLVDGNLPEPARVAPPAPLATPPLPRDAVEIDDETARGVPSPFSCPDCHGVLWTMPGPALRFRCRTGHDYSGEALVDAQSSDLESALWAGLRSAQEGADLARRLETEARARGHDHSAGYFAERYALALGKVRRLRAALSETVGPEPAEPGSRPGRGVNRSG